MASGTEGTDPPKHQTVALKVSIHCEGCKKKVKKVLQRVEGVYAIDIDSKQNKVTVTGSADAQSLIGKLLKYGKHAELWPETKASTSNSSSGAGKSKAKSEEKAAAASAAPKPPKTEQNLPSTEEKPHAEGRKPAPLPPVVTTAPPPASQVATTSDDALKQNNDAPTKNNAGEEPEKSEKPATKEESNEIKEKGKKVQKESTDGEERVASDSNKSAAAPSSAADSMSPPPLHPFPTYPQPMYTLSYNSAQPSISYAYYAPSPEAAISSSYTSYSGYSPTAAYPQANYSDSYYGSMEAPAMSEGSYDMFNDENPNACNLM